MTAAMPVTQTGQDAKSFEVENTKLRQEAIRLKHEMSSSTGQSYALNEQLNLTIRDLANMRRSHDELSSELRVLKTKSGGGVDPIEPIDPASGDEDLASGDF